MTHVFFDSDQMDWGPYIRQQQVGQGQMMGGREDPETTAPIFKGIRYMRGYGVRSAMTSIGRFLLPIASNLMESAKQEAGTTLGRIGADMAEGRPVMESLKSNAGTAARNMGTRIQQCGKGRKRIKKLALEDITGDEPIVSGPHPIRGRGRKRRDYLDL